MMDTIIKYDVALMNLMRSSVDTNSAFVIKIIHVFTDFQVILVVLFLLLIWLYGAYKKEEKFKKESLMIFYSIIFGFIIYIILDLGLPVRARPETLSSIPPLLNHLPDNSFPSGHAIFAGASTLAAYFYSKKWIFWLFLVFGILTSLARVLAGVHYPLDILAGFFVGIIGSLVVYKFKDKRIFSDYLLKYPILIAKFFKL